MKPEPIDGKMYAVRCSDGKYSFGRYMTELGKFTMIGGWHCSIGGSDWSVRALDWTPVDPEQLYKASCASEAIAIK